ncbi:hypothetical protein RYH73_11570 [Olivibacter sp. CPCC 100613]|uniref:hypothetical protein n=1 Tax=Olivibacter sp. CPCC 100613 TaxID=3079931 RepID=UPI002FFC9858
MHKGFIANKSNSIDTDPIHHLHNESCNICDFHLLGSGRIAAPSFVFLGGEVREMLNGDDVDFPHLDRCITDCLRGPPAFR